MENLIAQLFAARDAAHRLHLKTKSFAAHLALGDLYESLVDLADGLAEIHQGKYGIIDIESQESTFTEESPVAFIGELASWAESARSEIDEQDTNILNEWDNVLSTIYKAKYKLENLS